MVLAFIPGLLGRITCPKCGKDEVRTRAELVVGRTHTCGHCGAIYALTEVRNVASRGAGKKAPSTNKRR